MPAKPTYTMEKQDPGTQVVSFHGRITFGKETEHCRVQLKELLEQGERRFIFDLGEVEYVDSAGIGFLVTCLTTMGRSGASLRLAALPERVRYVLGITRLQSVFDIFEDRQQALNNFA